MKYKSDIKKFFIIERTHYENIDDSYHIYDRTMYDVDTAMKKLSALDTLNEDNEQTSYHLQEVNLTMVDQPLVLTDEVKDEDKNWKDCIVDKQDTLPF